MTPYGIYTFSQLWISYVPWDITDSAFFVGFPRIIVSIRCILHSSIRNSISIKQYGNHVGQNSQKFSELRLGKLIAHSKFHKICKFENHVTRNDDIMTSLPKTTEKCGPPRNQTNYISFERYWWELSKNVLFIEFESLCQKLWAFMSNFDIFYDARSPNMAMSRDPRSKFRKILFFPNSAFNIGKTCKISSRKALYFRSYQPKTSRGGCGKHPLSPSAFRIKVISWYEVTL